MKCVVGILVSALLVAAANAQSGTRNCSELDQTQVFTDLGLNGLTCGIALATANTPAAFNGTTAGVDAVEAACVSDCIGELAAGLLCECNYFDAAGLRGFCYVSDGAITYCREAFDDVVNQAITMAVGPCLIPFQGACPAGCAAPLQALVDEIGCCYQSIYNSTLIFGVIQTFPTEQQAFFNGLANTLLWDSCNVTIPDACPEPAGIPVLNPADCAATQATTIEATTMGAAVVLATKTVAVLLTLLAYYAV